MSMAVQYGQYGTAFKSYKDGRSKRDQALMLTLYQLVTKLQRVCERMLMEGMRPDGARATRSAPGRSSGSTSPRCFFRAKRVGLVRDRTPVPVVTPRAREIADSTSSSYSCQTHAKIAASQGQRRALRLLRRRVPTLLERLGGTLRDGWHAADTLPLNLGSVRDVPDSRRLHILVD